MTEPTIGEVLLIGGALAITGVMTLWADHRDAKERQKEYERMRSWPLSPEGRAMIDRYARKAKENNPG